MDNGINKISWRERIGLGSGELAQNLIYQTVSIWLLFFYTNVFGLKPEVAAMMFLVVRGIDILWDPVVGAFVDKAHPRWGKYRSWLILGSPDECLRLPMIIEHLDGDKAYLASVEYVQRRLCAYLDAR